MTTTRQINLMPEPGTPEFERFLDFMRQMYCDPANVRFRRHMQADEVNMRFLTQGGRMPLPDIEDPVRNAVEVTVTLLLDGDLNNADAFMAELEVALTEDNFKTRELLGRRVIDVLIPDDPKQVSVLDARHYSQGSHFTNPLDAPLED